MEAGGVDVTLASILEHAPNYRRWIVDLCAPHLSGPVLEMGAGSGTFTEHLAAFGDVTAVEPDARRATLLADRSGDDPRVTTLAGGVRDLPAAPRFGSAVMINVLERIDDDQAVLREILERLEPGGCLCIWAPTYEFLASRFDAELGHVRRYRKRQLEADVRRAGYEVVEGRHVNLPGWLGWLVCCRILRRRPTSPALVRFLDTWIVPGVRWFETRVRVPIAMSVFLVARRPAVVPGPGVPLTN
jgi:SAM-dependent methyltransferase